MPDSGTIAVTAARRMDRGFRHRSIALLSLPGALGWWLVGRTNAALAAAGRRPRIHTVGTFDTDFGLPPGEDETVLFFAHAPSRAFCDHLLDARVPTAMAIDQALAAVTDVISARPDDPLEALRLVSASAAVLNQVRALRPPLLAIVEEAATASRVIDAVARAFDLPREAFEVGMPAGASDDAPLDEVILRDAGPDRRAAAAMVELEDRLREHVAVALDPLVETLRSGRARSPVTWYYDVLLSGDAVGSPASMLTDVTGPARVLLYGPYFHLPEGRWTMRAVLAFSDDFPDIDFTLEVQRPNHLIAGGRFQPTRPGLFKVEMLVEIEFAEQPVEVRLVSEMGAIEGRIGLGLVSFLPLAD